MDGILEDAGLVFQGQGIVHEDRRYWEVKDRRLEHPLCQCKHVEFKGGFDMILCGSGCFFWVFLHPRAAQIWGLRMLRLGISMSTPKFR